MNKLCQFGILVDLINIYGKKELPNLSWFWIQTGSVVLSYVNMVCGSLRNSIPKSVVYCQVREAKRSLLDHFFAELGKKEVRKVLHFHPHNFYHEKFVKHIFQKKV